MTIRFENYGITAQAEISEDSNIWEVMAAVGGLLQVIGYGSDSVAKAIRDEDEGLWLPPTKDNLKKWTGELCLFKGVNNDDEDYFFLASPDGERCTTPFIPISTLCG